MKITAAPLEDAYQLLSREPMLAVSRNGSESLYVKMPKECIPRINALLVGNDIRIMELSPQQATLEDVFLSLTHFSQGIDSDDTTQGAKSGGKPTLLTMS